jgi:hypothetical protein
MIFNSERAASWAAFFAHGYLIRVFHFKKAKKLSG